MNEQDFEGTLILEKLSALNLLDAFYSAIDSDNFSAATTLMKRAKIDSATISIVLKKMRDSST